MLVNVPGLGRRTCTLGRHVLTDMTINLEVFLKCEKKIAVM